MGTADLELPELISKIGINQDLALPNVKRITDIRKFMTESKNTNYEKLLKFITGQHDECQNIARLLKDQVQQKLTALNQVKDDMLDLQRQLKDPDSTERFLKGHRVLVKFADETEINEFEIPDALARYSVKMSTLYSEILGLDSDVDYVSYLASVAKVNQDFVEDWFKRDATGKGKPKLG